MNILRGDILVRAIRRRPDARFMLDRWQEITLAAVWWHLQDVRRDIANADGVTLSGGRVVTVFNIRGNTYRLLTEIDYGGQSVLVLDFLTHAEYDKQLWKGRL